MPLDASNITDMRNRSHLWRSGEISYMNEIDYDLI